jgi:hypothetical protein
MKQNKLLTLRGLLAAILGGIVILSSCNGDETTQGFSDPSREVTFTAYAKKASRTRVTTITSQTIANFDVYGIYNDGVTSAYLPNMGGGNNPAYVSGGNNAWTYTPKQLWPATGTIDFYAYSPGGASNHLSYATEVISYTVPVLGAQEDLLVAVKPGIDCAFPGLVSLHFQHALSRVQLKARPALAGATYEINSVSFLNLCESATLALTSTNIPDNAGFVYNDNVNDAARTPLVLWENHGDMADYRFTFSANEVTVSPLDGEYSDIIVGEAAFMVLPQETVLGATVAPGTTTDPTTGFYVKIVYTDLDAADDAAAPIAKYFAVREPLNPALNAPLTFEAGRSYTFVVDLSDNNINFANVYVDEFNNAFGENQPNIDITPDPNPALDEAYKPAPHQGFAGSNIYWDGSKLTFEDVNYNAATDPANADKNPGDADYVDKSQYQGVFFKWGSLIGISPKGADGDVWSNSIRIYVPRNTNVNGVHTMSTALSLGGGAWSGIVAGYDGEVSYYSDKPTEVIKSGFLTFLNNDPDNIAAYKGDICAYLSGRPGVPAGYWRLPTGAEFLQKDNYTRIEGGVEAPGSTAFPTFESDKDDGTFVTNNGYRLTYAPGKTTFFPVSGRRASGDGKLASGRYGGILGSSPHSTGNGIGIMFSGQTLGQIPGRINREDAYPIRCVKK